MKQLLFLLIGLFFFNQMACLEYKIDRQLGNFNIEIKREVATAETKLVPLAEGALSRLLPIDYRIDLIQSAGGLTLMEDELDCDRLTAIFILGDDLRIPSSIPSGLVKIKPNVGTSYCNVNLDQFVDTYIAKSMALVIPFFPAQAKKESEKTTCDRRFEDSNKVNIFDFSLNFSVNTLNHPLPELTLYMIQGLTNATEIVGKLSDPNATIFTDGSLTRIGIVKSQPASQTGPASITWFKNEKNIFFKALAEKKAGLVLLSNSHPLSLSEKEGKKVYAKPTGVASVDVQVSAKVNFSISEIPCAEDYLGTS